MLDHPAAPHLGQVIPVWNISLECPASAGQEGVLQHVPKLDHLIPGMPESFSPEVGGRVAKNGSNRCAHREVSMGPRKLQNNEFREPSRIYAGPDGIGEVLFVDRSATDNTN